MSTVLDCRSLLRDGVSRWSDGNSGFVSKSVSGATESNRRAQQDPDGA